jgi:pimeloyl-ACP methyl ester carboxylesterase
MELTSTEKMIATNGVEICTESFGDPADPAILLIMGAMASMLWWDEELCRKLAARKRYVIRYDNRDTGRSTSYEPGPVQYSINEMVDDAIGVLDAYGIDRAHIVGMSLGGMIAQILAVKEPARVLTITMIASSLFGPERPDLPPIDAKVLAHHAAGADIDWSDETSVVDFMVGGWQLLAGSAHPFDEGRARQLATQEFRRATNLLSMMNHATLGGGEEWYDKIPQIDLPALVIHGTEDPVLPYEHALALATEIDGAALLTLKGTGHELPRNDWETIIDAIVRHTVIH